MNTGGGVYVSPGAITPGALPLPNAAALAGWHQALGNVLSGAGDATLLCVGDSILSGLFTNNIGPGPTVELEKVLANLLGVPVADGLAIPTAGGLAGPDNRWAAGAGWSQGAALFAGNSWGGVPGAGGQTIWLGANGAAGSLVFQPRVGTPNGNAQDLYSIGGGFSVNFNLGTDTVVGSLSGLQKTTVSGASAARPLCTVHAVTGALGCFIIGVDTRLTTTPTLRIGQAGVTSSSTGGNAANAGWTSTFGPTGSRPMDCLSFYNPNACLFNLGVNDLAQGIAGAPALANWTTMANAAKACQSGTGGVIFSSENPGNPATGFGGSQFTAYWTALKAFCQANGYGYIDIYSNLNGERGYPALAAMSPNYFGEGTPSIHPSTNPGSPDYGRMLAVGLAAL